MQGQKNIKLSLNSNTKTYIIKIENIVLFMTQQTLVGQGHHIIEISPSYSGTPHSLRFLWTRNRPVAELYTWKDKILKWERRPCSGRDSNP